MSVYDKLGDTVWDVSDWTNDMFLDWQKWMIGLGYVWNTGGEKTIKPTGFVEVNDFDRLLIVVHNPEINTYLHKWPSYAALRYEHERPKFSIKEYYAEDDYSFWGYEPNQYANYSPEPTCTCTVTQMWNGTFDSSCKYHK